MTKTNIELVEYAKKALAEGWRYWYGTTGVKCTEDLLKRKAAQYPAHYTSSRMATYKRHIAEGRMCADCVNLLKGFVWLDESTGKQRYASGGCPDTNADGMYQRATTKGGIDTMPELPGLALHMAGHAGVYIGDGWVIEARGFAYGVVRTRLKDRPWLHWFEMPGVSYTSYATLPADEAVLGSRTLRAGSKGADVKALQTLLIGLGYDLGADGADGDFGSKTAAAVNLFQARNGLKQDSVYGEKTHEALMAAVAVDGEEDAPEACGRVRITGNSVYVREGAGTQYGIITVVHAGDVLDYDAQADNGWFAVRVNGKNGWVSGKYAGKA